MQGAGQNDQKAGQIRPSGMPPLAGGFRPDRLNIPRLAGSNQGNQSPQVSEGAKPGSGGAGPAAWGAGAGVSGAGPVAGGAAQAGRGAGLGGADVGPAAGDAALAAAKATLRARILGARRAMEPQARAAAARGLRDALLELPELQMAGTVAAYASIGSEPDTRGLLFALWKRGTYVLLPALLDDGDLDWASYEGPDSLTTGARGLLEPAEARRGVGAITSADLVIVPALAVDQAGHRLGRGGGSYDRALARVAPSILTIALLYAGEFLADVPCGPHDQPVRAVATASEGITKLC